jgi:hypothetical protein
MSREATDWQRSRLGKGGVARLHGALVVDGEAGGGRVMDMVTRVHHIIYILSLLFGGMWGAYLLLPFL